MLTDALLAEYITELHTEGKSPSTIAQVVAEAKWLAKNHGIEIIVEVTSKTLAGIRREEKERGKGQVGMILTASDRVIFDMVIAFHLIESDSVITMSSLNGTGGCMKPLGS